MYKGMSVVVQLCLFNFYVFASHLYETWLQSAVHHSSTRLL